MCVCVYVCMCVCVCVCVCLHEGVGPAREALTLFWGHFGTFPPTLGTRACTVVVSYDRLANGNQGPDPGPGPHGNVDAAFTMRVTVTAGSPS